MKRFIVALSFTLCLCIAILLICIIISQPDKDHHTTEYFLSVTDKAQNIAEAAEIEAVKYEEEQEYEQYYPEYIYNYNSYSDNDFKSQGVIYENDTRYTWYSQNVLPGGGLTELNENGRHVEDGFVKDGDGYIAVASSDYEIGTVVETPFGEGKVYDTGCASGTIDIYTDF